MEPTSPTPRVPPNEPLEPGQTTLSSTLNGGISIQRPPPPRHQVTEIKSHFTARNFTFITLFGSIAALALLFESRVILAIRPDWPYDITSRVCRVMMYAAIILCVTIACSAINLFLTTKHLNMWAFIFLKNFIGDGGLNSLPYYMAAVGFMIFGDQGGIRGKSWSYSYSGDDWCGEGSGMYVYDDCTRVRGVVAALNKTAGVITIAIGVIRIGMLINHIRVLCLKIRSDSKLRSSSSSTTTSIKTNTGGSTSTQAEPPPPPPTSSKH